MHLNYQHLYYFKEIVEKGSLTEAAKHLKIGQPALTYQIKKLEEQLGHPLFDRVKKRLLINDAGKVAYEMAKEIFNKGDELKQFFINQTFTKKMHLRIGAVGAVPKTFFTVLIEFIQEHADCNLTVQEDNFDNLFDLLKNRQIDIIITDHQQTLMNKDIKTKSCQIFSEQVQFYASEKYHALKNCDWEMLLNHKFILPRKENQLREDIDDFFEEHDLSHETVIDTDDSALRKQLAIDGKGIIFLSPTIAMPFVKTGQLIEISKAPPIIENYWMYTLPRQIKAEIIDEIFDKFKI